MIHFLVSKKYIRIEGEKRMSKKRHSVETIVSMLREAEILLGKGQTLLEVLRQLGISDATYYKWRKEYGGLKVDQAKRYKELELENQRLRKVVADLTIDNSILKEYTRVKY
jgi:transposase-like protein